MQMAMKPGQYVGEVTKEMRKVHWPKQKELTSNTILTLVSSFILSLFIFFSDQVVSEVLSFIYR
jgi:preprotein translocase subunit SecE